MQVYDDAGNMCNRLAATISRRAVCMVEKLFAALFADGMTIIEARALLGYFKSDLDLAITISILQQQIEALPDEESTDR